MSVTLSISFTTVATTFRFVDSLDYEVRAASIGGLPGGDRTDMAQTHDAAGYSETADLRGGEAAAGRADGFVVTIRTPAGHEDLFRVEGSERVATVTDSAVAYFVA
jgi:hypothetical protein